MCVFLFPADSEKVERVLSFGHMVSVAAEPKRIYQSTCVNWEKEGGKGKDPKLWSCDFLNVGSKKPRWVGCECTLECSWYALKNAFVWFCGLFVAFICNSSKSKGLPCGAARKAVCWAARVCLLLLNPCFSHRFGTPCFQRNVTRITSVKRHCQHFYLVQPTVRSLKLAQKAIFFFVIRCFSLVLHMDSVLGSSMTLLLSVLPKSLWYPVWPQRHLFTVVAMADRCARWLLLCFVFLYLLTVSHAFASPETAVRDVAFVINPTLQMLGTASCLCCPSAFVCVMCRHRYSFVSLLGWLSKSSCCFSFFFHNKLIKPTVVNLQKQQTNHRQETSSEIC